MCYTTLIGANQPFSLSSAVFIFIEMIKNFKKCIGNSRIRRKSITFASAYNKERCSSG